MALINSGQTAHFTVQYDDLRQWADGRDIASAILDTCEADHDLLAHWFMGTTLPPAPFTVQVVAAANEPPGSSVIAIAPPTGAHPAHVRYLVAVGLSRAFLSAKDPGWAAPDGVARVRAWSHFLASALLGASALGPPSLDTQPANAWMQSPRADYVNNVGDDQAADGCGVLFLYYMLAQRRRTPFEIVAASHPDLAGTYSTLTGEQGDPFPAFKELLGKRYPGTTTIDGTHPDNPWPIGDLVDEVDVPGDPMSAAELTLGGAWGRPIGRL